MICDCSGNLFFQISFRNGDEFLLIPTTHDAEDVINQLASTMKLQKGNTGKKIFVIIQEDETELNRYLFEGHLLCILNTTKKISQMVTLARFIALQTLDHGGILFHGALIEKDGNGIILTGPGTVGKSTAFYRLPPTWNPICDDTSLIVSDESGSIFAHPWPTWSNFIYNRDILSWDTQNPIKIKGIFILSQSSEDSISDLTYSEKFTYLIESLIYNHLGLAYCEYSLEKPNENFNKKLNVIQSVVDKIPIHVLHISLTGTFWKELEYWIESSLTNEFPKNSSGENRKQIVFNEENFQKSIEKTNLQILYLGLSMNPLLHDYDLVEVFPYIDISPKVGDVIFFRQSLENEGIIHRIIQKTDEGYLTQGDNNQGPDIKIVKTDQIIGKVCYARTERKIRKIFGSNIGLIFFYYAQFRRKFIEQFNTFIFPFLSIFKRFRKSSIFQNTVKLMIDPKIVVFSCPNKRIFRLFRKNHHIGIYDPRLKKWAIRYPYSCLLSGIAEDMFSYHDIENIIDMKK